MILLIGFNACKEKETAPDYTTNYVGVFTETRISPKTSNIPEEKYVYEFSFSKKDNNTLNLNYTSTLTYIYNNNNYTQKDSYSLSDIKVDNSVMTLNEAVKLNYYGTDYNILFTGTGNLSNNSLLMIVNQEGSNFPKETKKYILLKK